MREIKFRAKIKGDVGARKVWGIDWLSQVVRVERACGIEWIPLQRMEAFFQYTGFKDKNSKEIYEGDILRYKSVIQKVVWEDCQFVLKWKDNHINHRFAEIYSQIYEVIGNIYENPELLEKENG